MLLAYSSVNSSLFYAGSSSFRSYSLNLMLSNASLVLGTFNSHYLAVPLMDSLILSKDFWDNFNSQEHRLKLILISKLMELHRTLMKVKLLK